MNVGPCTLNTMGTWVLFQVESGQRVTTCPHLVMRASYTPIFPLSAFWLLQDKLYMH
jgi:hypothetical protein